MGSRPGRGPYAKSAGVRRRVLEACVDAFAQTGFYGATMKDVARRAGISYTARPPHPTIPPTRTTPTGKDQLVTRTPNGPILDTFTPYGNMMLMQSKMKDTRVSAVSGSLKGDNGVYALAAKDRTGASLMVWNWQHTHTDSYKATIDMSRLPADLRHGKVRQRTYRIDQTTSNYFTNPATAGLQMVDQKTITPGKTHTQAIDLDPNAIYLITLEPMR